MKNYLKDFFLEFGFESEDTDYLLSSYARIAENKKACAVWEKMLSMYDENIECDYIKMLRMADEIAEIVYLHEYTVEFLMYVAMSRRLKARYLERGLSMDIYSDTVADLKYKFEECKLVRGICGLFSDVWSIDFFKMLRFGLGRLQFEINPLGYDYERDGVRLNKESRVINIHIPRTKTPLTPESCDEACEMAKEFFKGQYDEPCAFVCHSWLLYPENENIIPRHTNTYKFFGRFEIIDSGTSRENKDLWRLFDTDEKNYQRLPADSSFRRAYVEHLKNGGKTGWGMGIFFF